MCTFVYAMGKRLSVTGFDWDSTYDLSGFRPMSFEVQNKTAALNLRLPQSMRDAIKVKAKNKGIPYSRYIRMLIEHDLAQ